MNTSPKTTFNQMLRVALALSQLMAQFGVAALNLGMLTPMAKELAQDSIVAPLAANLPDAKIASAAPAVAVFDLQKSAGLGTIASGQQFTYTLKYVKA